jgi:hypothetical protein
MGSFEQYSWCTDILILYYSDLLVERELARRCGKTSEELQSVLHHRVFKSDQQYIF